MPTTESFTYETPSTTAEVTGQHFGLNHLFTVDEVNGSTQSDYEAVVDRVVNNVIRYPGGTVAERWFDPENPEATSGTDAFGEGRTMTGLTPLTDALQYAANTGSELLIVIPTWRYFDSDMASNGYISDEDRQIIREFVQYVLTHELVVNGQVNIAGFEIGNEWYQETFGWSAEQFGELSSQIAGEIQQGIDQSNGQDAMVFVQAGRSSEANAALRGQFDDVEMGYIHGVTTHFYTTNGSGNPMAAGGGVQSRLNEIYSAWGDDISVLVSEWNVTEGASAEQTGLTGLMRNAAFMRTFAEMIENGVDMATLWAAVAPGPGAASLSLQNDGAELTPTGYLYRMLSENVIGTALQTQISNFELDNGQGYAMVFDGDGRTVIYLVSGIDDQLETTADLSDLITDDSHIYATRLGMDEDDNTSYYGDGTIAHLTGADLGQDGDEPLAVSVGAYELIQIVVTDQSFGAGVYLYGDDQISTDDNLVGTINDDTLIGHAGDDTLIGDLGNDVLWGYEDDDSINGGSGNDTLGGGAGNDSVYGGDGDDVIWTRAGNNYALGGAGHDSINGGSSLDTIYGGDGNDTLYGWGDADSLTGQAGNDRLFGEGGDDTLWGGAGNDILWGGNGDNLIGGGGGSDAVNGGIDNDTLIGGSGDDTLTGWAGDDSLTGGGASDTFVFAWSFGHDTISDFTDVDLLDLSAVQSITDFSDLSSNHLSQSGGNTLIDAGGGNTITLIGVDLNSLTADDFIF
jgi:Ca2+-binding RTX toxin-like protein